MSPMCKGVEMGSTSKHLNVETKITRCILRLLLNLQTQVAVVDCTERLFQLSEQEMNRRGRHVGCQLCLSI